MRILSTLVLTHCFGCVIPADSDDNPPCQRPTFHRRIQADNSKVHIISSRGYPVLGPADADADDRRERFVVTAVSANFIEIPASGHELSRDTRENRTLQVDSWELPFWHHRERRAKPQQSELNKWRTPLRSHLRHILAEQHVGPPNRKSTAQKRNNSKSRDGNGEDGHTVEVTEEAEIEAGEWDEWTEWSECSASCSCGRQVRWRHCAGKGCTNGLKKAQIKTCHLRDCNSKNFLSWLGVKA